MMKRAVLIMIVAFFLVASIAHADDHMQRRIAECIEDNTDAKVETDVIKKYCICMSNKMGAGEMQSVSQWEKAHPVAAAVCDREAGWK